MMKQQVLFIQGGGEGAHRVDAALVADLRNKLASDYVVHYPVMPDEGSPDYRRWSERILDEFAALGDGAILVAHSVGATILVNALAETSPSRRINGLFLIAAPFVGEGGWSSDDIAAIPDLGRRLPLGVPIYLYHGTDDETAPVAHIDLYAHAIPQAHICRLHGGDHQLNNDLSQVANDIRRLCPSA